MSIEIKQEEALQVFYLLERLQKFFHQPLNYETLEDVQTFMGSQNEGVYSEIAEAYYNTVWNWLPRDIQAQLEERGPHETILPE